MAGTSDASAVSCELKKKKTEIDHQSVEAVLKIIASGKYNKYLFDKFTSKSAIWAKIIEEVEDAGFPPILGSSKKEKIRNLAQKWKNIRQNFIRSNTYLRSSEAIRKRKPRHYDLLLQIFPKKQPNTTKTPALNQNVPVLKPNDTNLPNNENCTVTNKYVNLDHDYLRRGCIESNADPGTTVFTENPVTNVAEPTKCVPVAKPTTTGTSTLIPEATRPPIRLFATTRSLLSTTKSVVPVTTNPPGRSPMVAATTKPATMTCSTPISPALVSSPINGLAGSTIISTNVVPVTTSPGRSPMVAATTKPATMTCSTRISPALVSSPINGFSCATIISTNFGTPCDVSTNTRHPKVICATDKPTANVFLAPRTPGRMSTTTRPPTSVKTVTNRPPTARPYARVLPNNEFILSKSQVTNTPNNTTPTSYSNNNQNPPQRTPSGVIIEHSKSLARVLREIRDTFKISLHKQKENMDELESVFRSQTESQKEFVANVEQIFTLIAARKEEKRNARELRKSRKDKKK